MPQDTLVFLPELDKALPIQHGQSARPPGTSHEDGSGGASKTRFLASLQVTGFQNRETVVAEIASAIEASCGSVMLQLTVAPGSGGRRNSSPSGLIFRLVAGVTSSPYPPCALCWRGAGPLTLYSFDVTHGYYPVAPLVQGTDGLGEWPPRHGYRFVR